MTKLRICKTHQLQRLNSLAVCGKYNRAVSDELLERLDSDGLHVINPSVDCEQGVYRCIVMVKLKNQIEPEICFLDIHQDELVRLLTGDQYCPLVTG